ncbi:MAG: hypothetical protein ABH816_00870 [Candidatus Levyibacteriota bacterium]
MWPFGKITIQKITFRNSTVLGATEEELKKNVQDVEGVIAELGKKVEGEKENPIKGIVSEISTYRVHGCLVENEAAVMGGSLEHDVTICGSPKNVKRVQNKLFTRAPDLFKHISFAPEEREKCIEENTFQFPRGFDFRRCNSVTDVVNEWLTESALEHGLFMGREKR